MSLTGEERRALMSVGGDLWKYAGMEESIAAAAEKLGLCPADDPDLNPHLTVAAVCREAAEIQSRECGTPGIVSDREVMLFWLTLELYPGPGVKIPGRP